MTWESLNSSVMQRSSRSCSDRSPSSARNYVFHLWRYCRFPLTSVTISFTNYFVIRDRSVRSVWTRDSLIMFFIPVSVPKSSHLVTEAKHAYHSRADLLFHSEKELSPSSLRKIVSWLVTVDVEASPVRCRWDSRGYPRKALSVHVNRWSSVILNPSESDLQSRHE